MRPPLHPITGYLSSAHIVNGYQSDCGLFLLSDACAVRVSRL